MILDTIKYSIIIVTGFFFMELIYKSKFLSTFRMNFTSWQIRIEMKCVLCMKKYKFLYRIILELFLIWFIFEWKNKLVISTIIDLYLQISTKTQPLLEKIKTICIFLSPYGRKIMDNDVVSKWMGVFSIGLLAVSIVHALSILLGAKGRIYKFFLHFVALFGAWYALLLSAFVISKIPQESIIICWLAAVLLFGFIEMTVIGILAKIC